MQCNGITLEHYGLENKLGFSFTTPYTSIVPQNIEHLEQSTVYPFTPHLLTYSHNYFTHYYPIIYYVENVPYTTIKFRYFLPLQHLSDTIIQSDLHLSFFFCEIRVNDPTVKLSISSLIY